MAGPVGVIKQQIHSSLLIDHKEVQRHFRKGPRTLSKVLGRNWDLSILPSSTASLLVPPSPDAKCFGGLGSYSYYSRPFAFFLPYCPHLILKFLISSPPTTFTFNNWLVHVRFLNSAHSFPPCLLSSLPRTLVGTMLISIRNMKTEKKTSLLFLGAQHPKQATNT